MNTQLLIFIFTLTLCFVIRPIFAQDCKGMQDQASHLPGGSPYSKLLTDLRAEPPNVDALRSTIVKFEKLDSEGTVRIDQYQGKKADVEGMNNRGIYLYTHQTAPRQRFLKVLSSSTNNRTFVTLLENSVAGVKHGAPKLLNWGEIHGVEKWPYLFLEFEHAFPGEKVITWKDFRPTDKFENEGFGYKNFPPAVQKTILEKIGKIINSIATDAISPRDLDFLITQDGRVKPIDCDWWILSAPKEHIRKTLHEEVIKRVVDHFPKEMSTAFLKTLPPWLHP